MPQEAAISRDVGLRVGPTEEAEEEIVGRQLSDRGELQLGQRNMRPI
jgi:hypothetical protein